MIKDKLYKEFQEHHGAELPPRVNVLDPQYKTPDKVDYATRLKQIMEESIHGMKAGSKHALVFVGDSPERWDRRRTENRVNTVLQQLGMNDEDQQKVLQQFLQPKQPKQAQEGVVDRQAELSRYNNRPCTCHGHNAFNRHIKPRVEWIEHIGCTADEAIAALVHMVHEIDTTQHICIWSNDTDMSQLLLWDTVHVRTISSEVRSLASWGATDATAVHRRLALMGKLHDGANHPRVFEPEVWGTVKEKKLWNNKEELLKLLAEKGKAAVFGSNLIAMNIDQRTTSPLRIMPAALCGTLEEAVGKAVGRLGFRQSAPPPDDITVFPPLGGTSGSTKSAIGTNRAGAAGGGRLKV